MRRLVYTEATRRGLALLVLILAALVFGLPLLMLVLASVAGQWNGIFPSHFTLEHLRSAAVGSQSAALWHSLATGLSAMSISVVLGAWGALAARGSASWVRHLTDSAYLLPIALPSVSIGFALLIAFSRPPLLLNGSVELVVLTHVVLVTVTLPLESVSHSRLMHWRAGVDWRASFLRTASG